MRFVRRRALALLIAWFGATLVSSCTETPAPKRAAAIGMTPPDTASGHQLAWVLSAFRTADLLGDDDVKEHFAPAFLERVPVAGVLATFRARKLVAATGKLIAIEPGGSERSIIAHVQTSRGVLRIALSVEPAGARRIEALSIEAAPDADPALADWPSIERALLASAKDLSLLGARVEAGKCIDVFGHEPDRRMPIGSAFKLYVLDAVLDRIAEKKLAWDDGVLLRDAWRSLPQSELDELPAGSPVSVSRLVTLMLEKSDDSATDHLLFAIGRDAVERSVERAGHGDPKRMSPLLSTREAFAIKLALSTDEARAWERADADARRKLLPSIAARELRTPAVLAAARAWSSPRSLETADWWASARELCVLLAGIEKKTADPLLAPAREALAKNPGLPDSGRYFRYVGYKGGSEPGVLNMSWLLTRASDGQSRILVATLGSSDGRIDLDRAIYAATAARDALGRSK